MLPILTCILYERTRELRFHHAHAQAVASRYPPRKLTFQKKKQEDVLKKAKKRIVTSTAMTRGIQGLSIEELKAKKSENPERRKAQREATVRYAFLFYFSMWGGGLSYPECRR